MRLLRRILGEKRALILPVAGVLALNALLYAVAVYPLTVQVRGAERRAAAAAEALRGAQAAHAGAREMQAGKIRADEELRRFYREVLPVDLASARRITYARLATLAQEAGLRYERRSSVPDRERGSHLARLRTTMILEGDYRATREFLYQVEKAPEFVVIEGVALSQREEPGSPLVLTLELSTYYWTGGDGT